jgi:hypothetical protein
MNQVFMVAFLEFLLRRKIVNTFQVGPLSINAVFCLKCSKKQNLYPILLGLRLQQFNLCMKVFYYNLMFRTTPLVVKVASSSQVSLPKSIVDVSLLTLIVPVPF